MHEEQQENAVCAGRGGKEKAKREERFPIELVQKAGSGDAIIVCFEGQSKSVFYINHDKTKFILDTFSKIQLWPGIQRNDSMSFALTLCACGSGSIAPMIIMI